MIARSNSKDAHHLKHSPSGRSAGFKPLLVKVKIASFGMNFAKKAEQVRQRTPQSMDADSVTAVSLIIILMSARNFKTAALTAQPSA
jgi:hypothetical protein